MVLRGDDPAGHGRPAQRASWRAASHIRMPIPVGSVPPAPAPLPTTTAPLRLYRKHGFDGVLIPDHTPAWRSTHSTVRRVTSSRWLGRPPETKPWAPPG